jgi:hypothetical protein
MVAHLRSELSPAGGPPFSSTKMVLALCEQDMRAVQR